MVPGGLSDRRFATDDSHVTRKHEVLLEFGVARGAGELLVAVLGHHLTADGCTIGQVVSRPFLPGRFEPDEAPVSFCDVAGQELHEVSVFGAVVDGEGVA